MDKKTHITGLEIAIIGMSGRFPGAGNVKEFWENLKKGVESISFFSENELAEAGVEQGLIENPHYVRADGLLEGIEYFDALFFGYTPNEAELMDPQQRIFHECAWEALEDAGYVPRSHTGLIGLYAGATANFKWEARCHLSGKSNSYGYFAASVLMNKDFLTTRVSFNLNLKGPSVIVQTACSTSLVAIHMACQALLNGECDMVLAGGITATNREKRGYMYQEGMLMSPDGHCRSFDARARGIVGGEGAGIVVLKRWEENNPGGDHIYAIIKGSAINNDGKRKVGYTAPSIEGQVEVIRTAQMMAEIEPESLTYIETHGTGTTLGDPVEIEALRLSFKTDKKGFCAVGSVKANVGHLDCASGAASVIKTALALTQQLIPPGINFETPNPQIDFIDSPFYVNTRPAKWERGKYPRRAGISSFGIGGTNAHIILEEAPPVSRSVNQKGKRGPVPSPLSDRQYQLILLSAKTETALARMTKNLAEYFKANPGINLADAAYTLQVGRCAFKYRKMLVCTGVDEAAAHLSTDCSEKIHTGVAREEEKSLIFNREKGEANLDLLWDKIGHSWLYGEKIDWAGLYASEKRYRISLPAYPFERQRYWIESVPLNNTKATVKEKEPELADWFYLPNWKCSVRGIREHPPPTGKRCWLVFLHQLNLGTQLVDELKQRGHEVVVVEMGCRFFLREDNGIDAYTIDPRQGSHYQELFAQLRINRSIPDTIIHLWNVTGEKTGALNRESFDEAQYQGFYSLLYIARAIETAHINSDIHIAFFTDGLYEVIGGEPLHPEKAGGLGLLKVIPQEYPGINCCHIDIYPPEPGSIEETGLIETLLEELTSASFEPVTAYRNNRRWIQIFEPFHLDIPTQAQMGLREQGVYLVTGGPGEIGLMFCELFVKHVRASLVLIGRSAFPPRDQWQQWLDTHDLPDPVTRKIKKLLELEKMGGKFLYIRADSAVHEQMKQAVTRAEETFGPINGVIHTAGQVGHKAMRLIREISPADYQLHLQAKVYGTMVLEELFKDKPLDFCRVISSVSCVLGGIGYGAYASANLFMDILVKKHNRLKGSPSRWFSLNWDGMDAETSIKAFERMFPLEKVDGLVFSNGGNLQERIDRWIRLETVKSKTPFEVKNTPGSIRSLHPRPDLTSTYEPPNTFEEKTIAGIWQELLGFDEIGIHDDFIEIGGDSLKAITIMSRIHQELNVPVTVPEFFNRPTIKEMAAYITENRSAKQNTYLSIEPVEKKEYYPLSSAQNRLFIMQQLEKTNTGYNISIVLTLGEEYDGSGVEEAFRRLIRRHESLRTAFAIVNNQSVQRVYDPHDLTFAVEYYDSDGDSNSDRISHIKNNFLRPFDLFEAPLIRVGLTGSKKGKSSRVLLVDMHHIISDGISLEIIARDFKALYTGEKLPPLPLHYKEFTRWQNLERQREIMKDQEQYWLKQFGKGVPRLNLPLDYPRPQSRSFAGGGVNFEIPRQETAALKKLAKELKVTLFMVLLAITGIWLAKICGQEIVVIGTGTAGRRHVDLQNIVGMFVNMLVLFFHPQREKYFREFLEEVNEKTLESFENQDYQYEDLVDNAAVNREPGRNSLFDVVLVLNNMGVQQELEQPVEIREPDPGLEIRNTGSIGFDICLYGADSGSALSFYLEYSATLFKKETIQRFIGCFKDIISAAASNNDCKIKDIKVSQSLAPSEDDFTREDYLDFQF